MLRWRFSQITGALTTPEGTICSVGYSGNGEGKNNPIMQEVHNVGPLPRGFYRFGTPYNSEKVGPFAIPLIPFPENNMYGRGGFRMHGDSKKAPGTASEGCIIQPRDIREACVRHVVDILEVV